LFFHPFYRNGTSLVSDVSLNNLRHRIESGLCLFQYDAPGVYGIVLAKIFSNTIVLTRESGTVVDVVPNLSCKPISIKFTDAITSITLNDRFIGLGHLSGNITVLDRVTSEKIVLQPPSTHVPSEQESPRDSKPLTGMSGMIKWMAMKGSYLFVGWSEGAWCRLSREHAKRTQAYVEFLRRTLCMEH
jgi:hypothetical protein